MYKLNFIRRQPWIGDYNLLVETINKLIDKINTKVELEEVNISREVKDFKFFNWEEVELPYHAQYTLGRVEDATKVFANYTLSYKEMKQINDLILQGKIISLIIDVTEEVTEKEKKQEVIFETVESINLDEPIKVKKKRGRKPKKKSSWSSV